METGGLGKKEHGGMGEFGFKVTDRFGFGAKISPHGGSVLNLIPEHVLSELSIVTTNSTYSPRGK